MSPRRQTAVLFLLALAALLPGIWEATGLTGKDEFFLGLRTPMEMMGSDHWLVPFLDGAPRIRKPPLLYWLGRADFELFGPSLAAARCLAVLFAALLVVATAGIARRLTRDATIGLASGLVLLGCLGLHTEGRRFMLDVPVAALSAAAFWALLVWLDRRHWAWLSLSAVLLAAGFLVKGPIVALLWGGGGLALLLSGRLSLSSLKPHWVALLTNGLLCAALSVPWFVVVRLLYPEAAQLAFADEVESRRFFEPTPGIFLALLNIGLPWVFVFLAAAWGHRREPQVPRLLLVWFLVSFLPFLLLKSFDRYLIGSLVPLAIFTAWALSRVEARWPFRSGLIVALLFGSGLAAFIAWFGLGGWYWLALPTAYLAWAWWQPRPLAHRAAAPALYWCALLWGVFPTLGVNAVPQAVLDLGKVRPVAFYDGPQPALLPILTGQPHRHYPHFDQYDAAELAALKTVVFAEADDLPRLKRELAGTGYAIKPLGSYATLASHGSGLRFARAGATTADWREAFASRRLEPLMTTICWFEVVQQ